VAIAFAEMVAMVALTPISPLLAAGVVVMSAVILGVICVGKALGPTSR
jgi:hypothetical protein